VPEADWYVLPAVTNMPRSACGYGQRKVYESPGGHWLSDSDADDVFLVSCGGPSASAGAAVKYRAAEKFR
jgi:hypothetical protein